MQSIVRKAVRPFMVVLKGVILSLIICATGGAWASADKTNPVTGETETYANTFTGSDGEWNDVSNWSSDTVPLVSGGNFDSSLVDGATAYTSTQINGWTPRVGAYNGATIQWNGGIGKIQTGSVGAWLTADATSTITIASFGGNQLEGSDTYPLKLSSANAGGITWTTGITSSSNNSLPFWYYLKGAGTVVYGGDITVANAQVIKMADVTLSGSATPSVESKTLVTFGSGTTKTFTAAADIKVYDGTTLKETVGVTSVRSVGTAIVDTSSTLTTSDAVGSCEIVQCTDGIVLYYVDGDPDAIVTKTYQPSININFTSGTALSTAADVGYGDYAVPGTSWDNLVGDNGTLSTVHKIDSTAAQSTVSGASVTISGTRGYYYCSGLEPTSDLRAGYIDENDSNTTPTVTVSGIPYDQYKVIVYTATDAANTAFGYITVNGTDYTYSEGALAEGTTSWGASGAKNTAAALAEGVNVLVSPVVSGGTLTVVGHRMSGARGCIAAIQIVKVEQELEDGDLLIELEGDKTYSFDSAGQYSTVYVTGEGTVTFAGTASTATTLHIGPSAAVNMNGSSLTPTTVTGNGTAIYDGTKPATGKGWTDSSNWTGVLWVKNCSSFTSVLPDTMVNANSTLRLTDCSGWFNNSDNAQTCDGTLELVDGNSAAFTVSDGYSSYGMTTFAKLTGDGTLTHSKGAVHQRYVFTDPSEFKGTINIPAGTDTYGTYNNRPLRVILGDYSQLASAPPQGSITIVSGATATVASGKTWTAAGGGIVVYGTLNVNGTLAVSSDATSAIKGSGTVVFTGRLPTPVDGSNETKWWKNANWTGTVQIDSLTGFIGSGNGTVLAPNDYGNTGSTLELKNCSGWLPVNYECSVPLSVAGTLTIGNGYSGIGNAFTIDHLKGSGQITCNGSAPTVLIYVREWSGYTGKVKMDNKMIVFGADTITESDLVSGTIYICEGAVVTNRNTYHWEPAAKMKVNGTFAVTSRAGWTDSKPLELGANGVVNFIGSGVNDNAYNFSNITGSGKILFSNGTGYSMLPSDASRMPSTDVAVVNDNTSSFVVLTCTGTTTIGTLSGSGKFDSQYGTVTTRRLAVVQSADSEWSGIFVNEDRVGGMDVSAKSGAAAKTLTLSGTQTASNELVVQAATETTDAGSVNLTGTWVGATTVAGTFGGTGTLTGNLTFNAGSTFKAFASDANGLAVSGTVAYPEEGTVTVDVSDLTLSSSGTTLITFTTAPSAEDIASKMAPSSGAFLKLDGSTLKAYPLVATYNGENYATFKEAIDAALATEGGEANLASITVVDATAELPAGYLIVDNNVVKAQGAIVDTEGTAHYYATPTAAAADIDSYLGMGNQKTYSYFAVYFGTDVEMSVNLGAMAWNVFDVKVKCLNDATVSVVPNSIEYEFSAGEPDENSIVTYTKSEKATTYVWVGTGESPTSWGNYNKWKIGTSEGAAAARAPSTLDTVIINGGAPILISGVTVAAMQIGGDAKISGSGTLTATTGGIVLTDEAATLTVTGVTLSPTPTTNVSHSRVKTVTVDGTTTYSVEVIPGTIFSVY